MIYICRNVLSDHVLTRITNTITILIMEFCLALNIVHLDQLLTTTWDALFSELGPYLSRSSMVCLLAVKTEITNGFYPLPTADCLIPDKVLSQMAESLF